MSLIEDLAAPEMQKMAKAERKAKPIGAFLEWLESEKKVVLPEPINDLLYDYFGVDKEKAKQEMKQLTEAAAEDRRKWEKDVMDRIRETAADDLTDQQVTEFAHVMTPLDEEARAELMKGVPEATREKIHKMLSEAHTAFEQLLEEAAEGGDKK